MNEVAIIVPVLNRPLKIRPLMESVAEATPESYRLLFVANEGDTAELAMLKTLHADFIVVPAKRRSWPCKINDGFRATTEPWVFTGADDLVFHPDWFSRALRWADDSIGVIGTNDLCNPNVMQGRHSTHSLFRRSYVEEHGTIDGDGVMHEGYGHAWSDNEAVDTAKSRDAFVFAFDALVEHMHPMAGKSEQDDTYRLGVRQSGAGMRLFQQRKRLWAPAPRQRQRQVLSAPTPSPTAAVIVTASYGGVDALLYPQAPQNIDVDWICFTDDPALKAPGTPWRIVVADPEHEDPRQAAAAYKMRQPTTETNVIWVDASMEITSPNFARSALRARHDGVAAWKHPRRDCAFLEAKACMGPEGQGKYDVERLTAQVEEYRDAGHPRRSGLYACGTIAWDFSIPAVREFAAGWLEECWRWRTMDQVSFPVLARRAGIRPGAFPVNQTERFNRRGAYFENRWLRIHSHVIAEPTHSANVK